MDFCNRSIFWASVWTLLCVRLVFSYKFRCLATFIVPILAKGILCPEITIGTLSTDCAILVDLSRKGYENKGNAHEFCQIFI